MLTSHCPIKIVQGATFFKVFTHIPREYADPEREIDLGEHGKILVTNPVEWTTPLEDLSSYYARLYIRDSNSALIARLTEDNLRLINKRIYGAIVMRLDSLETGNLDFLRGSYDLELAKHSLVGSGSYNDWCAVEVVSTVDPVPEQGPNNPGNAESVVGSGSLAWEDVANIGADDAAYATCTDLTSLASNHLKATNFKFDLNERCTITNIKVEIDRKRSDAANNHIYDYGVYLVVKGQIFSVNKAAEADWPTTDAIQIYEGDADFWGVESLPRPENINRSDFGVILVVEERDGVASTASVDHVKITVNFNSVGVLGAQGGTPFAGWAAGNLVHIANSENANEGIYKIHSLTDSSLVLASPMYGTNNTDDESIVISKVTLDETNVLRFVEGPVRISRQRTYG